MNFLWLTWKDRQHPLAGGAETVNEELAKKLVRDGHKVIFLVGGFEGAEKEETIDGYKVIRMGNRWTVYWEAYKYYKKNLVGWADIVIDEVNTIPFFAKFYDFRLYPVKSGNAGAKQFNRASFLFIHQLCREIWFYEIFFPLNVLGYFLEPIYLWLLSDRQVITVSESTKKDLLKYGFKNDRIHVISEGIELAPVTKLESYQVIKYKNPTILSLGSVRSMKRTDHIVKAFEAAKEKISDLELIVAGDYSNKFGQKVFELAKRSRYSESIKFLGSVDQVKKIELLQKSHLLCATSVKEGWGLVVTEANSQGTPAIVYGVDGLRDSVRHNETGIICGNNTPESLAGNIVKLIEDKEKYEKLRLNGWQWSKEINFEKSYRDFISAVDNFDKI